MKNLSQEELIGEIIDFSKKKFDEYWQVKILQAIKFALALHKGQTRYVDGPYVMHVLRVTVRAIHLGLDDPEGIIAALLHDSIEDQAKKLAGKLGTASEDPVRLAAGKIVDKFGGKVLQYVGILTIPKWQYVLEQEEKNVLYCKYVENLFNISRIAVIIKLADFLDNACSLADLPTPELRKRGAKKYEKIFELFTKKIDTRSQLNYKLDELFDAGHLVVNNPEEVVAELDKGLAEAEKILEDQTSTA